MEHTNDTPPQEGNTNEDWKRRFTEVTPLSKYLALALFIALPFLGFWLGMTYQASHPSISSEIHDDDKEAAPVHQVDAIEMVDEDSKQTETVPYFKAAHSSEGQQYNVELSHRIVSPMIYDLPCCDSYTIELLKYDPSLEDYTTVVADLSTITNYSSLGVGALQEGQNLYEYVSSKEATMILGWSQDGRYVYLTRAPYEGYNPSPVWYIDTEDVGTGVQMVDGGTLYGSEEIVLNPTKDKLYVFEAGVDPREYTSVSVLNLDNLNVVEVYSLNDTTSTFMLNGYWGSEPMIEWLDEKTLKISVVSKEDLQQCEYDDCLYSEVDYDELRAKASAVEVTVD